MNAVETYPLASWTERAAAGLQEQAMEDLESGKVLFFPRLAFPLGQGEERLLSPMWSNGRAKNISYHPDSGRLKGAEVGQEERRLLSAFLQRYADASRNLLLALFPSYGNALTRARTSFRPVEIAGRPSSVRKDDSRLHADAFPTRPTGGHRILRVFCNVNPSGKPRQWRLGEDFQAYASRFVPSVRPMRQGAAMLMQVAGITKGRRSPYDHYMLQLHDLGKMDDVWQRGSQQERFDFPAGSTWLCFTDQALHAVKGGQYLLEQTFHLPPGAQRYPERAPLHVLETLVGRPLLS